MPDAENAGDTSQTSVDLEMPDGTEVAVQLSVIKAVWSIYNEALKIHSPTVATEMAIKAYARLDRKATFSDAFRCTYASIAYARREGL